MEALIKNTYFVLSKVKKSYPSTYVFATNLRMYLVAFSNMKYDDFYT